MKKYKNIVFDLDGTISDSSLGIINGFKYALNQLNYKGTDLIDFKNHIGAPLYNTFHDHFFNKDQQLADQAIALYRDYYNRKGKFENQLYPDVLITLNELSKRYDLYVLTNKTHVFAIEIIKYFELNVFFKDVFGLDPLNNKTKDLIALEMNKTIFHDSYADTIMIGDTFYDMECATKAGWDACFVTYGFGDIYSLREFKPKFISENFKQLSVIFK